MLITSMQSARPRGASAVRDGRNIPQSRASVLRRCSPAGSPNAPQQQPSKAAPKPLRTGLVSIAGDLHLHIDAINVHLTASALAQTGQQGLATTVQTAVVDAATSATAAGQAAPSREPAPIAPESPFTCIGDLECPEVSALAMCSDGHHLVCGCGNGHVALWDKRKPGQRLVAELGSEHSAQCVAVSADCERILAGSEEGLWLWDVGQGKVTHLLKYHDVSDREYPDEPCGVWCMAITPDGRFGVSGSVQGHLRVWDLERGERIGSEDADGDVLDVVISPNGQTATALVECEDSSDSSDTVRHEVWRWCAGSGCSSPVQLQGSGPQQSYAMSDRGVVLAAHSEGTMSIVRRWDGHSGEGEAAFSTQAGQAGCLYLSADGRRALLRHESAFSVWDVEGKACLATLDGHKCHRVHDVAISADGRYAVSYSFRDDRLCVWHLG